MDTKCNNFCIIRSQWLYLIINKCIYNMLRLVGLLMVVIIILAGIDYIISSSGSQISTIIVTGKSTDGNVYFIETMSLDRFKTTHDIYYKLDGGTTYKVKIYNNDIIEIIGRV